ncbi:MAG: SDR family NAD(P)-dependent oxidoreductase [Acidimicrobiia bacterium]|nr:SDR family NAD(P)-dependent oxidoreductase [Acidimicrobiia bacterium]
MSRIFVTGASGFIGGKLASRLVADGHDVRALARSEASRERVRAIGAEPVEGDLSSVDALRDQMEGCELVYHVAGVNEMCSLDELQMFRSNVTGTRNVVAAAAAASVRRVIYTSSAVVVGEPAGTVGSERSVHRGKYLSAYERSKHEAELVAFTAAGHHGVDVVAVNPSSVQGPGRVEGSARLFLYALRSQRPWLFDTSVSVVDIDDCVEAHLRAADVGVPGARYVVSGATIGIRDAVAMLGEVAGVEMQPRMVPRSVIRGVGVPLAYILRYIPTKIRVCPELLRTLLHGHTYDGSRASRELGLRYTPIDQMIERTVAWYRSEGLLDV